MNPGVTAASNGVTITASMICCVAFLYKHCWKELPARPLFASTLILALTVVLFGLQSAFPGVLRTMRLDVASLRAGEWWRLITPLFVQPYGWFQFLPNIVFLAVFLPMAERLYGAKVWILFLGTGLAGQIANIDWRPGGGGSSTAAFGLMGAVLAHVLWRWTGAPRQYGWFAILGILGAVVMCYNRDGHGAGVLTGAALAGLMCWLSDREHETVR